MKFADPRVQQYLTGKEIVVLGTINPDGSPLLTAMWFLHDSSAVTLISVDNLQKVRNLRRDQHFANRANQPGPDSLA